jgi:tetratricopeptide (TPR) repeat protein
VDSWINFGVLYSDNGKDSQAIEVLTRGLEKNPGNQSLLITIGNVCMRQNNWDCAIAHFEKARAAGFNAPKILMTLSELYFNARRFQDGEALRDSVIAMGEDGAVFYFFLGKSMNYLERYQDAADYYRKGFAKPIDKLSEEEKLTGYVGYIKSLIRLGKADDAVRVIHDEASKNIKDSENVKDVEGIVYLELKRYDDAIAIYKWLADADPDNPRYVISLSQSYFATEKYTEAERVLLNALKKTPDNTRFLMQLGIVYDASKEFNKAEDTLLKVIRKEPDNAHALNNLAYMYIENGKNLSKAIEMAKRALKIDPNNGAYLDTLGWGYFRKGNISEAKTHIERALKVSERQDKGVIYDHYGDILLRMGLKKEAGDAYTRAIEYGEDKGKIQKKIDSLE